MPDLKKVADTSHLIKRHRAMVFLSSVLAVLFLSVSTILAVEYYMEKIVRCDVSDSGICFDMDEGTLNKATIKNLEDGRKYRIIIKKKTPDGRSYVVGSVDINNTEAEREAKKITCTDSDGGKNFYVSGRAELDSQGINDECTQHGSVIEVFCENGNINEVEVQCSASGCSNGACLLGQWGDKCFDLNGCNGDLQCKPSGRYPAPFEDQVNTSEWYCCKPDECASVIPSSDSNYYNTVQAPHCVGNGGTDEAFTETPKTLVCEDGEYTN